MSGLRARRCLKCRETYETELDIDNNRCPGCNARAGQHVFTGGSFTTRAGHAVRIVRAHRIQDQTVAAPARGD